jgi:hypothetical protein
MIMTGRLSAQDYEELRSRQQGRDYDAKPCPGVPKGRRDDPKALGEQLRRALLLAFPW